MKLQILTAAFFVIGSAITSEAIAIPAASTDIASEVSTSDIENKAIVIRDQVSVMPSPVTNLVALNVKPTKNSFRVGENIHFKVSAKSDYYLYVFSNDIKSGEAVILIPNKKTKSNRLRANKTYDIPGTVDFYSDAVGTEQIIFIATKEALDLGKINSKNLGDFSVAKSADLDLAFSEKTIRLRDPIPANSNTPSVVTVNLSITP